MQMNWIKNFFKTLDMKSKDTKKSKSPFGNKPNNENEKSSNSVDIIEKEGEFFIQRIIGRRTILTGSSPIHPLKPINGTGFKTEKEALASEAYKFHTSKK